MRSATHPLFVGWGPAPPIFLYREMVGQGPTLAVYPSLGRVGRVRGTRELVVSGTPFVVVYRVRLDIVQVLRVLHHARKWP